MGEASKPSQPCDNLLLLGFIPWKSLSLTRAFLFLWEGDYEVRETT